MREDQQAAARAAGANDVLPKPMDLDQMAPVLASWITPPPDAPAEPTPAAAPLEALADMDHEFPDIAGIDRKRASQRLGGDRDMFLDLLRMFVAEYAEAVARTRADLDAGDRVQAARRMHTLRSSAGFLCALDVMDAAGDVEDAIDADDGSLAPALGQLERALRSLLEASAPWH